MRINLQLNYLLFAPTYIDKLLFLFLEMVGVMALRQRPNGDRPLHGARVVGCTHLTAQTAVCLMFFIKTWQRIKTFLN